MNFKTIDKMSQFNKHNQEINAESLSDSDNNPNFVPDPNNELWYSEAESFDSSGGGREGGGLQPPYFRDVQLTHRQQIGGTCVSNVLSIIANMIDPKREAPRQHLLPKDFQKPNVPVNTNDPVSWSNALSQYGVKLAYCTTDCRRLKHYLPELLKMDDLFTISFYCCNGASRDRNWIVSEPDSTGKIVGSHIILLHRDQIYDTCWDKVLNVKDYSYGYGVSLGDLYVKRIFRVVPAGHSRGLTVSSVPLMASLAISTEAISLIEEKSSASTNSTSSTSSSSDTIESPIYDSAVETTSITPNLSIITSSNDDIPSKYETSSSSTIEERECDIYSASDNHPEFVSDPNSQLWHDSSKGPFFRDITLTPRRQIGGSCVSNVLAILTNTIPRRFQKPDVNVNTQDPVSWSNALLQYGMKFAFCAHDCRRIKHYLTELLEADDLFTISFYTRNKDTNEQVAKKPKEILREPNEKGEIVGAHIVILHRRMICDSAKGKIIPVDEYKWNDIPLGELFVKRIFRIVPASYPVGL